MCGDVRGLAGCWARGVIDMIYIQYYIDICNHMVTAEELAF